MPGVDQVLYKVAAGGDRVERGVRALHTSVADVSMSRRGSGPARIAYTSRRVDVGLRLVDLGGSRRGGVFGDVRRFSDSTRIDVPGRFSADGKRVAFLSDRSGYPEAWIANADGSGLRQATTLHATELLVGGWSPDQRRLVVDADIAGNSDVYVIRLDGGPPVRLTTEPGFDGLTEWSSDGRWIYFTSNRSGRIEVWRVPADGGPATRLTRNGGAQPREAPDGRMLFYLDQLPGTGGLSGRSRLMQVPVDGGEEAAVLDRVHFGLWAVTNDGIVFLTVEKDDDALDFYAFRDRRVHRLGALPFRASRYAGLGALVVSQDGRSALASVTDVWESDIMVADGLR
jgi:dipeptidyl aminopeptidase/acylaminoacyl peptidase